MKRSFIFKIASAFLISVLPTVLSAQTSVGINTESPNQNAVLELVSPGNNQGVLIPQLTTVQRTTAKFISALSGKPENNGLLVYDKDLNSFFYWENTQWQSLLSKDLSRVVRAGNSTDGLTITGLIYPKLAADAANKGYVDDTVSRVIMRIENIENIVNQHTTQINQLTDSIFVYSQYFNEYWDSIVNYSEHFNVIFDSIKVYNEHFTTLFDSVYSYSEHFTTLFDSIKVYNEHLTTIKESITKIEQTFEKAEFNLPQGEVYIGNTTGLAKTVAVTGDVLIDGNGVTTIQANTVTNNKLDKSNIPLSGFGSPQSDIDVANNKLIGVASPINANDAVNKSYSDIADSALSQSIIANKDAISISDSKLITLRDSVKINIGNIGTLRDSVNSNISNINTLRDTAKVNFLNINSLRDSVKTNITGIDNANSRIKELSDTAIAQITINRVHEIHLRDSLNYIYKTGKLSLSNNTIFMGGADDTARTFTLSPNDFNISDKIYIADGAIVPKYISGIITDGTAGEILVSKGNGTFEWQGKFSGGMSDDLQDGYFWVGNGSDKANAVNKTAIPISGFANATTNVSIGDGVTNFKITNVLNPVADQDAATKKYVDDSLAIHNTAIKTNASDIAGITTKLNITSLTTGAVPYWNTTKFEDSKIWSNGSKIVIGGNDPASGSGFTYDCEINGTFKTQKIYHSSDERWKKDIEVLDSALAKVLMMNGVQYNWRKDEFPNKNFPEGLQIGLIAQQIEKIAPELVATDNEGYKAVEYSNMVAFLIEAIKAQQKIIDDQQKKLNENDLINSNFESRLKALESIK